MFSTQFMTNIQSITDSRITNLIQSKILPNPYKEIHLAAKSGDLDKILHIIAAKENLDELAPDDFTALHLAIQNHHTNVAEVLIAAGANVNIQTIYGYTALHTATKLNNLGIIGNLIQAGASVNITANNEYTALYIASSSNHPQAVQILVNAKADMALASQFDVTPLSKALLNGNIDTIRILLSRGAPLSKNIILADYKKESLQELQNYDKDPVNYILTNHVKSKDVLEALKKIKPNVNHQYLVQVTDCLQNLPESLEEIDNPSYNCGMSYNSQFDILKILDYSQFLQF